MTDTTTYPVPEVHEPPIHLEDDANGIGHRVKPTRPDPDAWRAIEAERLTDAEKELARDQKALEAAQKKLDELTYAVWFLELQVGSRAKGLAEFDRLRKKTTK